MKQETSIFRKFTTLEQASELKELLSNHGIQSIISDDAPPLNLTFSEDALQNRVELRIQQKDFGKAEEVLSREAEELLNQVDENHYLFDFTNEELYDILTKPDEWNEFDYKLAHKILKEQGEPINEEMLASWKANRINDLAQPEKKRSAWFLIGGYISAFLGGFAGLIIGYIIWTSKKTLPTGEKVHSYSEDDRKHGKYIFYIGLVIAPIALLFKVFGGYF
jgi:hypothetical protein